MQGPGAKNKKLQWFCQGPKNRNELLVFNLYIQLHTL